MPTQCISEQLGFEGFDGRRVGAALTRSASAYAHDGGAMTSDAGALLLRETDRAIGLIDRVAACFRDGRDPGRVVHSLRTLIGQRIIGLALGYEDVADHDELRLMLRIPCRARSGAGAVCRPAGAAPLSSESLIPKPA